MCYCVCVCVCVCVYVCVCVCLCVCVCVLNICREKSKGSIISVSEGETDSSTKDSFEKSLATQLIQQQQSLIKLLSDLVEIQKKNSHYCFILQHKKI